METITLSGSENFSCVQKRLLFPYPRHHKFSCFYSCFCSCFCFCFFILYSFSSFLNRSTLGPAAGCAGGGGGDGGKGGGGGRGGGEGGCGGNGAIPAVSDLHYALTNCFPNLPRSPYTFSPLLCLFRKLMRCHFVEPLVLGSKEPQEHWKTWPGFPVVAQYHNENNYPIMREYVFHPSHT